MYWYIEVDGFPIEKMFDTYTDAFIYADYYRSFYGGCVQIKQGY